LVASHRGFDRAIWRCVQVEAEDVIAIVDDVDVVAPAARQRGDSAAMSFAQRVLRHGAGMTLAFDTRLNPIRIEKRYDLFFFLLQRPRDLALLKSIPNWRERCTKAVCWIDEMWLGEIDNERINAPLRQFDHVAVNFLGTVEPLQKKIGVPCSWVPLAADMARFCPWPNAPRRVVDVLSMGRRAEETHQAVKSYAASNGWFYLYDTIRPHSVYNPIEHRKQMTEMVKRTRFFTASNAKADVPEETGGQQELALRFFEGAAGGAVILGQPPKGSTFTTCFDWEDSIIPLAYGSPDVEAIFDSFGHDHARMARISRENVVQCLRRHDWAHRWKQILQLVDLPPTEALTNRIARLDSLASQAPRLG
jgi:hypothetical protein